jgi:zinc protease
VPTYAPAGGVHLDVDAKVALLAVVVPGVSYELSRREMHAMRLLHTVVGGGASSRLQRLLRDRLGMSYQVRSSLEPHQRSGALLAILGCAPDRAGEAVVTVRKALGEAVDEPVTPAELARAREVSRGTHVHERETAVDRCFGVAYDLFRRGDVASDDAVFDLWGEIDAAEIQATARRHLRLDEARYVVVGPAEARQSIDATGAVDRWTDV